MDAGLNAFASADPLREEFEAEIQLAAATGAHPPIFFFAYVRRVSSGTYERT